MRTPLLSLVLLSSCRVEPAPPELPARPPPSTSATVAVDPSVEWVPSLPGGRGAPVVQARVASGARTVGSASVVLVQGELSDVAMRGLREGKLPASAQSRQISAQVVIGDGVVEVAPSAMLTPGQSYTLAVGPLDLRASLVIASSPWPVLDRVWPPGSEASERAEAVFCGPSALDRGLTAVGLGAGQVTAGALGHEAPGCVTVATDDRWMLPAAVGRGDEVVALLAPGPLVRGERAPAAALSCQPGEVAFGPGCVRVLDDRALWRLPGEPWLLLGERPRAVGASVVLRGMSPSSSALLEATVVDLRGDEHPAALAVLTGPPEAHVVINEVLADALGPEPAGEWIELRNDGATPVDLSGWSLDDGGGSTGLPATVVAPGGYLLLVNEGFDPSADVAPPSSCPIASVKRLGQGGLSNQGEALALRDASGDVRSRWPAAPRPKPGVSVIRRHPDDPDDDPASFSLAPGGRPTPCADNGF